MEDRITKINSLKFNPGDAVCVMDSYTNKFSNPTYEIVRKAEPEEYSHLWNTDIDAYVVKFVKAGSELNGSENIIPVTRLKKCDELNEEITQVASVDAGKITVFGNDGNTGDWYEKLFELNDHDNSSNFIIKSYTVENTGGGTLVAMGTLENGKYFGLSNENLVIFDENYHLAYLDMDSDDLTDWEEEHAVEFYNEEEDEYYAVANQIKEFKKEKIEETEELDLYEELDILLDYLNEHTAYNWTANEMYDNCAIMETDEDYVEVYVKFRDNGDKYYTINDEEEYEDLETLISELPILDVNETDDEELEEIMDIIESMKQQGLDSDGWKKEDIMQELGANQGYDREEQPIMYNKIISQLKNLGEI